MRSMTIRLSDVTWAGGCAWAPAAGSTASTWRGSPPPCPPRVRDYYSTIQPYHTCTATRRAPFPYKLTRPCQIVRVTLRRLSQLAPAISRYLPLWWDNFNGSSIRYLLRLAHSVRHACSGRHVRALLGLALRLRSSSSAFSLLAWLWTRTSSERPARATQTLGRAPNRTTRLW